MIPPADSGSHLLSAEAARNRAQYLADYRVMIRDCKRNGAVDGEYVRGPHGEWLMWDRGVSARGSWVPGRPWWFRIPGDRAAVKGD